VLVVPRGRYMTFNLRALWSDRLVAAEDRVLAAEDGAQAAEREDDEVDALTAARRRAPGLVDIQHEIARANRGDGRLIAVYVDVDGTQGDQRH